MTAIHATAIIDPGAELDESVSIGAYTLIGPHVKVGAGTSIGAHCVIEGHTSIGRENRIFQFNSLGAIPQDKKYQGEPCGLLIGDRNTIREFCTFNIGSPGDLGVTRIGDDNWIMAYTHVAHDCQIANHTTLANNTTLGGHVHLGEWVTIGGLTGVHQFVKVGAHAMVGFASAVAQDVPPYMLVDGNPLAVRGVNSIGLRRRDFSVERVAVVKAMHKALYREDLTLQLARQRIADLPTQHPESLADVQMMLSFLEQSSPQRGIVR
ncbi:MAG: acyl-ACP--UDP-N-acetylglucosamine O-acyltransferase [Comamonadaceae bacterium]|nr:MAG: acyl-ACP--UDP-N-acetylglucosamine O-acyltransferase [Comamonadaceae bacterium]